MMTPASGVARDLEPDGHGLARRQGNGIGLDGKNKTLALNLRVHFRRRAEVIRLGGFAGQGDHARAGGRGGQALSRRASPRGPAPLAAPSAPTRNWSSRPARPGPRPRPGSGGRARTGWRVGRAGRRLRRLAGRGRKCCFARSTSSAAPIHGRWRGRRPAPKPVR